jgi:hypothetical protein
MNVELVEMIERIKKWWFDFKLEPTNFTCPSCLKKMKLASKVVKIDSKYLVR